MRHGSKILSDQSATLSKSGRTVRITCQTASDAVAVFDYLESYVNCVKRTGAPVGIHNGHSVLTTKAVKQIRAEIKNGKPQAEIAAEHGVSHHAIYSIKTRRTWKHVI